MNPLKKYYQPDLSDNDWKTGELSSFEVYHLKENCKKDFPDFKINEYSGNDIEFPHFRDTNDYVKKMFGKVIKAKSNLKQMLTDAVEALIYHHTDDDHTFIELSSPVALNWVNDNNHEEITRVYADGGVIILNTYGKEDNTRTINELNSDQLYDLLTQLNANEDVESEVK